jgi:hypothetical protein
MGTKKRGFTRGFTEAPGLRKKLQGKYKRNLQALEVALHLQPTRPKRRTSQVCDRGNTKTAPCHARRGSGIEAVPARIYQLALK